MPAPRELIQIPPGLPRPAIGQELTGAQAKTGIASVFGGLPGYGKPPAGTYDTYRQMSTYPTVAFAKAMATAPVKAAGWGWEKDEDVPQERLEYVRDQIEPRRRWLVTNALNAVEYGWQSFELVHDIVDGAPWGLPGQWLGYRKFKPLVVADSTEILIDRETGAYRGIKQGRVTLPPEKTWLYTHDWSPGNLHGRSRHENIRSTTWTELRDLGEKEGRYVTKMASLIVLLQYPPGRGIDEHGVECDTYDLGKRALQRIASGHSVLMPNTMADYYEELARQGITDPKMLRAWAFDMIEAKGRHGQEFVEQRRHKEQLVMQGWLVPPRSGLEGQFGTKAEAGVHASAGIAIAEEVHLDLVEYLNLYLVDPLLRFNWGEEAAGTIRVVALPLVDEKRVLFEQLILEAAKSPMARESLEMIAAVETMAEALGLPIIEARKKVTAMFEETEDDEAASAAELWRAGMAAVVGDDGQTAGHR